MEDRDIDRLYSMLQKMSDKLTDTQVAVGKLQEQVESLGELRQDKQMRWNLWGLWVTALTGLATAIAGFWRQHFGG